MDRDATVPYRPVEANGGFTVESPSPTGTAVNRYNRFSQMIGDADPRPGTSTFQRILVVSLHSSGGSASGATPVAKGPRQAGQYWVVSL